MATSYNTSIVLVAPFTQKGKDTIYMLHGITAHAGPEPVEVDGEDGYALRFYNPIESGLRAIAERFGLRVVVEEMGKTEEYLKPLPKPVEMQVRL